MGECWQNFIMTFKQMRIWYEIQLQEVGFELFYYSMQLCDCNWRKESKIVSDVCAIVVLFCVCSLC